MPDSLNTYWKKRDFGATLGDVIAVVQPDADDLLGGLDRGGRGAQH